MLNSTDFLLFLVFPFTLIVSSVHGALVSSSGFTTVPGRSLSAIQQHEFTKDSFGENIVLPLTEIGSGGNFGVQVGFGTPKTDFTLLFDTGSDTSWIQCQPCASGCNHQQAVFDPSNSQTISNASCDQNGGCRFVVKYNDGTSSSGYFVNDTLTLTDNDKLPGFVFGCAQNIGGGDFPGTSGVLGTGKGRFSLISQTDTTFFGLFCYCLPATDQNSKGFLAFGVQAFAVCPILEPKKMLSLTVNPNRDGLTQYLVKLLGITIGQKRLEISSISGSPLDIMVDSGTIISRLPSPVYSDLRSEFKNIMSGFPVADPSDIFDTCYNLGSVRNWTPPEMVLHFENSVDVKLDPSAVTVRNSDSQVCLAFAGNKDENELNIIGNQQLREINVLFDVNSQKLAFSVASTGCSM